jgi:Cu+-exporting ATPase
MKRSLFLLGAVLVTSAGLAWIAASDAQACDWTSKARAADATDVALSAPTCGDDQAAAKKVQPVAAAKAPKSFDKAPAVGTKATCPVMGGEFVVAKDSQRSEHKGKHVVFCCPGCKPKFDADPQKYL